MFSEKAPRQNGGRQRGILRTPEIHQSFRRSWPWPVRLAPRYTDLLPGTRPDGAAGILGEDPWPACLVTRCRSRAERDPRGGGEPGGHWSAAACAAATVRCVMTY